MLTMDEFQGALVAAVEDANMNYWEDKERSQELFEELSEEPGLMQQFKQDCGHCDACGEKWQRHQDGDFDGDEDDDEDDTFDTNEEYPDNDDEDEAMARMAYEQFQLDMEDDEMRLADHMRPLSATVFNLMEKCMNHKHLMVGVWAILLDFGMEATPETCKIDGEFVPFKTGEDLYNAILLSEGKEVYIYADGITVHNGEVVH